jgi:threonine dehydratase
MLTFDMIVSAARDIDGAVVKTPLAKSMALSTLSGGDVSLKLENQQVTGSFKARGALVRLLRLNDDERRRGVIAASAGNHAQGVAYHATRLGITSTIVMPIATPLIKVTRTQGYGARVILHGDNYDDAYAEARRLADIDAFVYVHAYDDDHVMAGQGTIGLELLDQRPDIDTVIVPIGGGGLIGGIGTAVKAKNKNIRIVGVEAAVLPSMKSALAHGAPIALPAAHTLAEGIAVRQVGQKNVDVCKHVVDDIVTVTDDHIARAILFLLEQEKTVAEGAGAAGVAAVLAHHDALQLHGRHVAVLVCGGNIDVSVLSRIIERGLVETGRLARFSVDVPDRPGALADMLADVATTRANVLEVHHERAFTSGGLFRVRVELVLETRGPAHVDELRRRLLGGAL